MQTQLDGVKSGFIHLKTALNVIQEIKSNLKEDEETLVTIPSLVDKLRDVREESMKHTQYAAAMENLKHIFNVPESVQKTRKHIADGKLLLAHQSLSELENSRDGLLYEMHRLGSTQVDKNLLKHYFSEVENLSDELGKQLWLHIRMTLNSAKNNPSVIVTALRIIEREEKSDEIAQKKYEQLGFMPQGRPKQWKKRVFEILEEAVSERISGSQLEDRSQEKMWLVRHLEIIRRLILDDLKVVKYACINCFPPSYMIISEMFKLYHKCLSSHLQEVAQQLEGNEFVTLLNWVQSYEGAELLGHPDLSFDLKSENLEPLLPNYLAEDLSNKYLHYIDKNYKGWMSNTINRETKDWYGNTGPDSDDNKHYQTTTPLIVFSMIDQHLEVAKTVSSLLVSKVLVISLDHLTSFAKQYKEAISHFSKVHFDDRTRYKYFTAFMIASTNDCLSFPEIVLKFCTIYKYSVKTNESEFNSAFKNVLDAFETLRLSNIQLLLKELFLDIEKEILKVGNKEWLDDKGTITENVRLTVVDYVNDYDHLKEKNFQDLRTILEMKLATCYLQALLQKKITFKDGKQRSEFAKKFESEINILKLTISKLPNYESLMSSTGVLEHQSPFDCFHKLIEFLKLNDLSMLYLEVSVSFIKRFSFVKNA